MFFTTKRQDAQSAEGFIRFKDHDLGYKAAILPPRGAPHVSADSPRHMEPPRPAAVLHYVIFNDNGVDVTNWYAYYEPEIKALILDDWMIRRVAESLMVSGVVA
jgi:hypothetical protein